MLSTSILYCNKLDSLPLSGNHQVHGSSLSLTSGDATSSSAHHGHTRALTRASGTYRVRYLGSRVCNNSIANNSGKLKEGISAFQKCFLQIYSHARRRALLHRSVQPLALNQVVDICGYGVLVAQADPTIFRINQGTADTVVTKVITPLPNILLWAAVRFNTRVNEKRRSFGAAFVPLSCSDAVLTKRSFVSLSSKQRFLVGLNHPPLFVCVLQRVESPKILECHMFICDEAESAINLCALLGDTQKHYSKIGALDLPPPGQMGSYSYQSHSSKSIKTSQAKSGFGISDSDSSRLLSTTAKSTTDGCSSSCKTRLTSSSTQVKFRTNNSNGKKVFKRSISKCKNTTPNVRAVSSASNNMTKSGLTVMDAIRQTPVDYRHKFVDGNIIRNSPGILTPNPCPSSCSEGHWCQIKHPIQHSNHDHNHIKQDKQQSQSHQHHKCQSRSNDSQFTRNYYNKTSHNHKSDVIPTQFYYHKSSHNLKRGGGERECVINSSSCKCGTSSDSYEECCQSRRSHSDKDGFKNGIEKGKSKKGFNKKDENARLRSGFIRDFYVNNNNNDENGISNDDSGLAGQSNVAIKEITHNQNDNDNSNREIRDKNYMLACRRMRLRRNVYNGYYVDAVDDVADNLANNVNNHATTPVPLVVNSNATNDCIMSLKNEKMMPNEMIMSKVKATAAHIQREFEMLNGIKNNDNNFEPQQKPHQQQLKSRKSQIATTKTPTRPIASNGHAMVNSFVTTIDSSFESSSNSEIANKRKEKKNNKNNDDKFDYDYHDRIVASNHPDAQAKQPNVRIKQKPQHTLALFDSKGNNNNSNDKVTKAVMEQRFFGDSIRGAKSCEVLALPKQFNANLGSDSKSERDNKISNSRIHHEQEQIKQKPIQVKNSSKSTSNVMQQLDVAPSMPLHVSEKEQYQQSRNKNNMQKQQQQQQPQAAQINKNRLIMPKQKKTSQMTVSNTIFLGSESDSKASNSAYGINTHLENADMQLTRYMQMRMHSQSSPSILDDVNGNRLDGNINDGLQTQLMQHQNVLSQDPSRSAQKENRYVTKQVFNNNNNNNSKYAKQEPVMQQVLQKRINNYPEITAYLPDSTPVKPIKNNSNNRDIKQWSSINDEIGVLDIDSNWHLNRKNNHNANFINNNNNYGSNYNCIRRKKKGEKLRVQAIMASDCTCNERLSELVYTHANIQNQPAGTTINPNERPNLYVNNAFLDHEIVVLPNQFQNSQLMYGDLYELNHAAKNKQHYYNNSKTKSSLIARLRRLNIRSWFGTRKATTKTTHSRFFSKFRSGRKKKRVKNYSQSNLPDSVVEVKDMTMQRGLRRYQSTHDLPSFSSPTHQKQQQQGANNSTLRRQQSWSFQDFKERYHDTQLPNGSNNTKNEKDLQQLPHTEVTTALIYHPHHLTQTIPATTSQTSQISPTSSNQPFDSRIDNNNVGGKLSDRNISSDSGLDDCFSSTDVSNSFNSNHQKKSCQNALQRRDYNHVWKHLNDASFDKEVKRKISDDKKQMKHLQKWSHTNLQNELGYFP